MGTRHQSHPPKFAVLENVKGICPENQLGRLALDAYIEMLHEAGLPFEIVRLQAANFGVPQLRERVICLVDHRRPRTCLMQTQRH